MRCGRPFADANAPRPAPEGKGFRGFFLFKKTLPNVAAEYRVNPITVLKEAGTEV